MSKLNKEYVRGGLYFVQVFSAIWWHIKGYRGEGILSRAKKQQCNGIKSLYSNTSYGFKYKGTA